jgi:hypothetical protein
MLRDAWRKNDLATIVSQDVSSHNRDAIDACVSRARVWGAGEDSRSVAGDNAGYSRWRGARRDHRDSDQRESYDERVHDVWKDIGFGKVLRG